MSLPFMKKIVYVMIIVRLAGQPYQETLNVIFLDTV